MDAAEVHELLETHPGFKGKLVQFMTLYDAVEVLGDLGLDSDIDTWVRYYLQRSANKVMRDAGMPEEFILAMIAARPPADPGHPLTTA